MRNADFYLDEDDASDLLKEIQKQLKKRAWGEVIRLEVESGIDEKLLDIENQLDKLNIDIFQATEYIKIPKNREISDKEIPETYVPARNIIFLSFALAYAESTGAENIFIGANAVDYSGYPDCRPEFFSAFKKMANAGTKAGVEGRGFNIHTPLMHLYKHEIIKLGSELGVDYSLTHSCYDPSLDGSSCGECDSCKLRMKGFEEAGVTDPTKYRDR